MIAEALIVVALIGLATSTIYLLLVVAAAIHFKFFYVPRTSQLQSGGKLPGVSVLKPLHGMEPFLRENLESFFQQDYPEFELVFCARHANDPALQLAQEVAAAYPHVPVSFLTSGEPLQHPKVHALVALETAAQYDVLVTCDSDVRVAPGYLREVVGPFATLRVGEVTCICRGRPVSSFWAWMEAFGFSVEETSGVLVANMLEGMKFSLGPTMVFRRECVRKFGGFGTVAKFPAEDFELARRVGMAGYDVVLSGHAVDHTAKSRSLRELFAFQLRWARYARHYRPKGHLGSGLIFAMPYGLLGLFAAIASGRPLFGALLLLAALVQRTALSVVAGLVVRDRRAITACWLYPVRDLLGFAFWCAGYAGRDVTWSQERYFISPSGELVRRSAAEVKLPASDAV